MSSRQPVELPGTDLALPEYNDPPVIEVALSVQFEALQKLKGPQVGLLWGRFREAFPNLEEHAPLPSIVEVFGTEKIEQNVQFELMDSLPPQRTWFLSERGEQLIQVQQDRLIHNWRKKNDDEDYPRYDRLVSAFRQELHDFNDFVTQEKIGELVFTQCEVTYVNHLSSSEWNVHEHLERAVSVWSGTQSDSFLPAPEDSRFATRYIIPSSGTSNDAPLGRLHVIANPAFRVADKKPVVILTLTARSRPIGNDWEAMNRALDLGHEWVVRGFTSITTPFMHHTWGRRK